MKLRLISTVKILFIVLITALCAETGTIEGNWGAISPEGDYSELYFNDNQIRIFTEVGGIIAAQHFEIVNDSLKTNVLTYKMDWINPDSLILRSERFNLILKRIKKGYKLGDYTNESYRQKYTDSFYDRMYHIKGIKPNSIKSASKTNPKNEEETINIKQ